MRSQARRESSRTSPLVLNYDRNPRWEKILKWLIANHEEICQAEKGHIRIDYAGRDGVSFEISRKD